MIVVQLALLVLALILLGLVIGVGRLIYTESTRYQTFMQKRPVLGWLTTTVVGGLAYIAVFYTTFYAILLTLTFLLRGGSAPVQ